MASHSSYQKRRTKLQLLAKCLADQCKGFRTVPLLGSMDLHEHAAMGVDQNRQRNRIGSQHVFQYQFSIEIVVKRNLRSLEECRCRVGVVISGNADDIELFPAKAPGKPLE